MGFITVAFDLASLLCIMWNQNKPLQLETGFASNAISFTFCKYPGTASLIFNLPSSQLVACARHFIDLLHNNMPTTEQGCLHFSTGKCLLTATATSIYSSLTTYLCAKKPRLHPNGTPHGNCLMLSSKKKEKKKKQPTSSSSFPDNSSYKKKEKKRGKETNHKRREKKEEMDLHQTGQNEGTRKRDGKLVAFDLRKRKGFVP
ncbi:hypothetical protein CBS147339_9593 [Penicillium roqueforti]|nr:hypothetical protein DTO012A8_8910 [Penicillium roqueforti]KAI3063625.1 hypothetical protein CBS147339_9593 [Penicillium roqueforti]KAI3093088.1 hypothetical protein CBS147338_7244 [Penicillium roqueforti]KAI3181941.1 hypothetical protein DTO032C6_7701 [Penicillium roqueforti]